METKQKYRKELLKLREEMPYAKMTNHSDIIIQKLLYETEDADTFFAYISTGNEVRTHELIETLLKEGRTVTVPKIFKKRIIKPCQIKSLYQLAPGKYGIPEPTTEIYKGEIDIGIIPGVAFSEDLERIGMGQGYYDRFLEENIEMKAIALAYNFQVLPEIPTEPHDQPMDMIITEKRIII